jgi:hypothetical protein
MYKTGPTEGLSVEITSSDGGLSNVRADISKRFTVLYHGLGGVATPERYNFNVQRPEYMAV